MEMSHEDEHTGETELTLRCRGKPDNLSRHVRHVK